MNYEATFINTECPVARASAILGDKWSLMLVRDAFDGVTRFSDFQKSTLAAKNILTSRLKKLVDEEIFALRPASDGSAYQEYALTEKGRALFPLIVCLRQWGEENLFHPGETHSILVDNETDAPVEKIVVRNRQGETIGPERSRRKRVMK